LKLAHESGMDVRESWKVGGVYHGVGYACSLLYVCDLILVAL